MHLWSTYLALVTFLKLDDLIILYFMSYSPYLLNLGFYLIPMAWKRHLWATDLTLITFLRLDDLIIFNFMSFRPYMPNLGFLPHSHGLEEAPVVHRPGPDHLADVGRPYHWPFPVH